MDQTKDILISDFGNPIKTEPISENKSLLTYEGMGLQYDQREIYTVTNNKITAAEYVLVGLTLSDVAAEKTKIASELRDSGFKAVHCSVEGISSYCRNNIQLDIFYAQNPDGLYNLVVMRDK